MMQPYRRQSTQTSETFLHYDAKASVRMLAFIMLLLYMLGAIAGLYKVNNPWGKLTLIVYLLLSLISLLDNVNARFFRSSHWYIASTVIWANCVYIGIVLLVFATIFAITFVDLSDEKALNLLYVFWIVLSFHIAVQMTYVAALRKVSKVRLTPSLPAHESTPMLGYAHHPQQSHA